MKCRKYSTMHYWQCLWTKFVTYMAQKEKKPTNQNKNKPQLISNETCHFWANLKVLGFEAVLQHNQLQLCPSAFIKNKKGLKPQLCKSSSFSNRGERVIFSENFWKQTSLKGSVVTEEAPHNVSLSVVLETALAFSQVQFPVSPPRSLWTNSQFHEGLNKAAQPFIKQTGSLGTRTTYARDVSHPVSLYWTDFKNLAHSKSHRLPQNSRSLLGKQDQESVISVCNTKVTPFTWDVFSSIISLWL